MALGLLLPGRVASADAIGTIRTIGTGLAQPRTAAVAANGDVYITDTYHHQIRRLDRVGVMTTIAGDGYAGSSGDGGQAVEASLDTPHGVAVDNRGHVFIADSPNHRVRMVDLTTGIIRTVAGTGQEGFSGDGGPATAARLNRPRFLIVAPDGSLIIADTANYRVRRVDPAGTITTIAGTGQAGYSGDGGPATAARLDDPRGLALDAAGNLYVSNAEGSPVPSVRRIDPAGVITTVAGGRPKGFAGDGGPATEARLNEPRSIAIWRSTLYIADSMNNRIRAVDLTSGVIRTVAGTGAHGFGGDGGPAESAKLAEPRGVAVTPEGDVIVVDTGNDRLRSIDLGSLVPPSAPAADSRPSGEPNHPPAAPTPPPTAAEGSSKPLPTVSPPATRPAAPPTTSAPTAPSPVVPPSPVATTSSTTAPVLAPATGTSDRRHPWRADLGLVTPAETGRSGPAGTAAWKGGTLLLLVVLLIAARAVSRPAVQTGSEAVAAK
jgi:sugar lactone lactonase YvrE